MADTAQRLEDFIRERFLGGRAEPIDPHASFAAQRLISSSRWLEVMLFLEQTFGIRVEDHELSEANFGSLHALCQYVEAKRSGA